MLHRTCPIAATAAALALAACAPAEQATHTDGPLDIAGFSTPESVLYDAVADVYLVSNINGAPLDKDDNGFIARVSPAGEVLALHWIDGSDADVALSAPKGMALIGDTLFVTDIDAVRLFDRRSGAVLGSRNVPGATFLNDLAAGPDGTLYLTDTGLRAGADGFEEAGTDAVYRFEDGTATPIATGPSLGHPNGVAADRLGVTVVTFGSGTIYRLDPRTGERTDLPMPAQGQLDGVVLLGDGGLLVSSWAGSAVYRVAPNGQMGTAADSVPSPADIGYDAGRRRLLIPLFTENRVLVRPLAP